MSKRHAPGPVALLVALAWVVLAVAPPAAHGKHWILLGTAHVDKSEDHKTSHVGGAAGQFHRIQLRVNGGPVEFQRVVVHFADGTKEELAVADRVRAGGKTREIELPGELRTIDGVELWYSKENLETRPEVALYATR